MGLDTSHDCWHGAYSGFRAFRDAVAAAAKERFGYVPHYEAHPERAFMGWWDKDHETTDILDVFFVHSDCEGYIFPQHAEDLADRLGQLDVPDWQPRLDAFIAGLRVAADEWEIVEFH